MRFCFHYLRSIVKFFTGRLPNGPVWSASATACSMLLGRSACKLQMICGFMIIWLLALVTAVVVRAYIVGKSSPVSSSKTKAVPKHSCLSLFRIQARDCDVGSFSGMDMNKSMAESTIKKKDGSSVS